MTRFPKYKQILENFKDERKRAEMLKQA